MNFHPAVLVASGLFDWRHTSTQEGLPGHPPTMSEICAARGLYSVQPSTPPFAAKSSCGLLRSAVNSDLLPFHTKLQSSWCSTGLCARRHRCAHKGLCYVCESPQNNLERNSVSGGPQGHAGLRQQSGISGLTSVISAENPRLFPETPGLEAFDLEILPEHELAPFAEEDLHRVQVARPGAEVHEACDVVAVIEGEGVRHLVQRHLDETLVIEVQGDRSAIVIVAQSGIGDNGGFPPHFGFSVDVGQYGIAEVHGGEGQDAEVAGEGEP